MRRLRGTLTIVLAALAGCLALLPGAALATDTIYWGNLFENAIASASLSGMGATSLSVGGATVFGPFGVAIDSAAGRIYWVDGDDHAISFANLDGSGGADLAIVGATVAFPSGIALDPIARRLYWTNDDNNTISTANLDGSGGSDLPIRDTTIENPLGIALDAVHGRLYWVNSSSSTISTAKLDGSDAHDLTVVGATVATPFGIAVDPVAGRLYWANFAADTISSAQLDGSDGADLAVGDATVRFPIGVAVDPAAGRIYWANGSSHETISFARLDGSGGENLIVSENGTSAGFPALLLAPRAAAPPLVSGDTVAGSTLACSQATWAPDLVGSFVYQAPQQVAYQWSRDDHDLAGATQSTLVAEAAGDYRCRVTAENHAGSTPQTSAAHRLAPAAGGSAPSDPDVPPARPAFGSDAQVTLALTLSRVRARGPAAVRIVNANAFAVTGTLSARTVKRISPHKRRIALAPKALRLAARATQTVKLTLPRSLQQLLRRRGSVSLALSATVTDPAGNRRTLKRTVTLKLRR